jgi:predicted extracellular nuclease
VAGVVVTGIKDGAGFYVQDPDALIYGGIFVYDSGSHSSGTVAAGDVITVSGVYSEYYGLSQIGSPEIEITGTSELPTPVDIADTCSIGTDGTASEGLENMVVRVSHVTVSNANPDAPDDYQEFELNSCLRVDDQLSDVLVPQPVEGTYFNQISGVLSYTYGNAKLAPRGAGDVVE